MLKGRLKKGEPATKAGIWDTPATLSGVVFRAISEDSLCAGSFLTPQLRKGD